VAQATTIIRIIRGKSGYQEFPDGRTTVRFLRWNHIHNVFGEAAMRKFFGNHITILGLWLSGSALLVVLMTFSGIHS